MRFIRQLGGNRYIGYLYLDAVYETYSIQRGGLA